MCLGGWQRLRLRSSGALGRRRLAWWPRKKSLPTVRHLSKAVVGPACLSFRLSPSLSLGVVAAVAGHSSSFFDCPLLLQASWGTGPYSCPRRHSPPPVLPAGPPRTPCPAAVATGAEGTNAPSLSGAAAPAPRRLRSWRRSRRCSCAAERCEARRARSGVCHVGRPLTILSTWIRTRQCSCPGAPLHSSRVCPSS